MMRTIAVAMMVVAAGCGGGDDCQRFVDKAGPMLAKTAGKPFGDAEKKQFVEMCRKNGDKAKSDPVFKCVLDAKDDAAVGACLGQAFGEYTSKSKATEAKLLLNRLAKSSKLYWAEHSELPKGKAGPFPAQPCCSGPDHKCPVADWSKDPVWSALEFEMDEPSRFQYTYESDGQSAKATAIGDMDCDGQTVTYTLDVTVDNGMVKTNITDPTTED